MRDDCVYLDDMLTCVEKARRYTSDMAYEEFVADEKTYDAVLRNLEILGEAAGRVSGALRARHAAVAWRSIVGLRHVLAHGYGNLRNDVPWDVLQHHLPTLEQQIRHIIALECA